MPDTICISYSVCRMFARVSLVVRFQSGSLLQTTQTWANAGVNYNFLFMLTVRGVPVDGGALKGCHNRPTSTCHPGGHHRSTAVGLVSQPPTPPHPTPPPNPGVDRPATNIHNPCFEQSSQGQPQLRLPSKPSGPKCFIYLTSSFTLTNLQLRNFNSVFYTHINSM